jgi:hypothetical protein
MVKVFFLLILVATPLLAQTPNTSLSPAQLLAYDSRVSQESRTYISNLWLTVGGTMLGVGLLMQDDNLKQSSVSFGLMSLGVGAIASLYRPSVETYYANYRADPEHEDPKALLAKLQEEYRLTRYVLGGSVIGLGLLFLPKGELTDTEHQDLNLYWRAAMLGLGVATLLFPMPAEVRYQEALSNTAETTFFAEPYNGRFAVGLRHVLN